MGFEKIDAKELSKMDGLNDFFEHDFTPAGFASHKNVIGPLLTHLRSKLVKQVGTVSHEELRRSLYTIFTRHYPRRRQVFVLANGCCHPVEYFRCALYDLGQNQRPAVFIDDNQRPAGNIRLFSGRLNRYRNFYKYNE